MHSYRIHSLATNSKNYIKPNIQKKKKRLTWNNKASISFTYSNEEYDRSIDGETILTNKDKKINGEIEEDVFKRPLERNPTYIHDYVTWRDSPYVHEYITWRDSP